LKLFVGVGLFLTLAQAGLPLPTLEVRPSTSNVSIGERFQVTLEARGESTATYEFPKEVNSGSVELILSRPLSAMASIAVYEAQVFALGSEGRVPEIEVQYTLPDGATGIVKSAPIPLNVISTLDPNDENPAPADFAPPVPVLVSRAFWITSGVVGLLLVAGLVMLVRRLRFPKKPVDPHVTPAISPEEETLGRLEALATARAAIEAKAFYIQLIQIVKMYLERRLEAPVLEMTSTETLAFVKAHAWTAPHGVGLRDLVTSADLVKFGGSSDASNADRQIQLARDLVGRIDRLRRAEAEIQTRESGRKKPA
jgi:hypothetical protein